MYILFMLSLISTCLSDPTQRTITDLSCKVHNPHKKDCGFDGINQKKGEELGCCWKEDSDSKIPWCFFGQNDTATIFTIGGLSCALDRLKRKECGYYGIEKTECEGKGCCWRIDDDDSEVPWCYEGITDKGVKESISTKQISHSGLGEYE